MLAASSIDEKSNKTIVITRTPSFVMVTQCSDSELIVFKLRLRGRRKF
jgi:hypothetical protein